MLRLKQEAQVRALPAVTTSFSGKPGGKKWGNLFKPCPKENTRRFSPYGNMMEKIRTTYECSG